MNDTNNQEEWDDVLYRLYNVDVAPIVKYRDCDIKVVFTGGDPLWQYHIYKRGELLYTGFSNIGRYSQAMDNAKGMIRSKGF